MDIILVKCKTKEKILRKLINMIRSLTDQIKKQIVFSQVDIKEQYHLLRTNKNDRKCGCKLYEYQVDPCSTALQKEIGSDYHKDKKSLIK